MIDLVPQNFQIPEKLETSKFIIRKLLARDVYLDYLAVMSSIDIIAKTRGKGMTKNLTFEDDMIDLAWHQREFEHRTSFAFTVMNPNETECLGCVYLYPAGERGDPPKDADVDVSFWVTQKAYDNGLYKELYITLKNWLEKKWPFKNPHWTNIEIPNF
jgi:hypothetical protein